METLGPVELLIIFAIILVLFGVGRIAKVGRELGEGIRAFREGLQGKGEQEEPENPEKQKDSDTPSE